MAFAQSIKQGQTSIEHLKLAYVHHQSGTCCRTQSFLHYYAQPKASWIIQHHVMVRISLMATHGLPLDELNQNKENSALNPWDNMITRWHYERLFLVQLPYSPWSSSLITTGVFQRTFRSWIYTYIYICIYIYIMCVK